jgi:hypothetical protein
MEMTFSAQRLESQPSQDPFLKKAMLPPKAASANGGK